MEAVAGPEEPSAAPEGRAAASAAGKTGPPSGRPSRWGRSASAWLHADCCRETPERTRCQSSPSEEIREGCKHVRDTHGVRSVQHVLDFCFRESNSNTGGTTTVYKITTNTCGMQKVNDPDAKSLQTHVVVSMCLHFRDKHTQTCHINLTVPRLN